MRRLALALLLLAPAVAAEGAEERGDDLLIFVVLVVLVSAGVGITIFFLATSSDPNFRRRAPAFAAFAERNGLEISGMKKYPYPEVEGIWNGRQVRLDISFVEFGPQIRQKQGVINTRLLVSLQPSFEGWLELVHEGLKAKLGKRLGGDDLKLHYSEFDSRYRIECSDRSIPPRVLGQAIREKLLRLRRYRFTWAGDEAEAEREGVETDAERLQALLEILSDVADELTRYSNEGTR